MSALSDVEKRWAREVGRALIPAGTLGAASDGIDVGDALEDVVAKSPWWTALTTRLALALVWFGPLWRWGSPRTFGSLDAADRERIWEDLLKVSIYATRQLVYLLKMNFFNAVIGDERVLQHLGAYDHGKPARPTVPARALTRGSQAEAPSAEPRRDTGGVA